MRKVDVLHLLDPGNGSIFSKDPMRHADHGTKFAPKFVDKPRKGYPRSHKYALRSTMENFTFKIGHRWDRKLAVGDTVTSTIEVSDKQHLWIPTGVDYFASGRVI